MEPMIPYQEPLLPIYPPADNQTAVVDMWGR